MKSDPFGPNKIWRTWTEKMSSSQASLGQWWRLVSLQNIDKNLLIRCLSVKQIYLQKDLHLCSAEFMQQDLAAKMSFYRWFNLIQKSEICKLSNATVGHHIVLGRISCVHKFCIDLGKTVTWV